MEKELFIDVLRHYSKSSEGEALNIISLKQEFPYSQVLQALAARLSKDHGFYGQKEALQSAAVYAADRNILKNVMTGEDIVAPPAVVNMPNPAPEDQNQYLGLPPLVPSFVDPVFHSPNGNGQSTYPPFQESPVNGFHNPEVDNQQFANPPAVNEVIPAREVDQQFVVPMPEESPMILDSPVQHINDQNIDAAIPMIAHEEGSVADEIMGDLERLNQLKRDFEVLYAATKSEQALANAEAIETRPSYSVEPVESAKVERLVEMDNALNDAPIEAEAPKADNPKPSMLRRRFGANEAYIDEIVNRKELEPENLKQKEQLQMIEQFIKTQPSITPNKDKVNQTDGDLNTIKTGEFTDNIVSETLVEILLKQGKKDKAIEVLKKLIWKFPQKKAYFAAQIEDLKK